MPRRAARPCRHPGCPSLVRGSDAYCEEHARERQQQYDAERGSAAQRGYGAAWRKLRRMYLRRHPLCEDPDDVHGEDRVAATEVHHRVPLAAGGTNAFENLQALCKPCHSRITARESRGWHRE